MTWGALSRRLQIWSELYLLWAGRSLSLGFKLAVPVLVSTVALVAGMGTFVATQIQSQIESAYNQRADEAADGVAAAFLVQPDSVVEINDYLRRIVSSKQGMVSIRVLSLDSGWSVIASSNSQEVGRGDLADANETAAARSGRRLIDQDDGGYIVAVYPLRDDGGELLGAILITSSRADELAAARAVASTIFTAGSMAIMIDAAMILSALYFGILRRTRRVQRAVEAVGDGDTSIRLAEGEEPPGRDEIFNLARSVSHTIEALDERKRWESLIRDLTQQALTGTDVSMLLASALATTRRSLGLESCIFVSIGDDSKMGTWIDEAASPHPAESLPVWVSALTRVAVEARRPVASDRMGQSSRLVEGLSATGEVQAIVVPLSRTSHAGQAILAIAAPGEKIPEGGIAVLDAVAATIAGSLHMQAAEAARAESAVKSRVMSAVSHEMRNPLNSILGFTGLVLGGSSENLTPKQRRQLGFVQTSANNMLTLVSNYLDLARLRSGTVSIQYETVQLEPLVAEVANVMQPIAAERKVSIRTSVTAGAVVWVDPTRVRQVLTNLVSNAIKFTPEDGHIYIRARIDRDTWKLVVSDTGVGIPKAQAALVFTEFAKIDAGTQTAGKGTGLGLALTRAFVSAMGGSIKFYSRPRRGTTFVVTLPRERDARSRAA